MSSAGSGTKKSRASSGPQAREAEKNQSRVKAKKPAKKLVSSAEEAKLGARSPSEERVVERASMKKALKERTQLIYDVTKVIVPLWFGQVNARQHLRNRSPLPVESALCLMILGSAVPKDSVSMVGIERCLRPSGFSRDEAYAIALMGTSSLFGLKLVKYVERGAKDDEESRLARLTLTAKGEKLYDLAKRSILEPLAGRDPFP